MAFHAGQHIANRLRRAISGEMWHGSAVDELLAQFTAAEARQHAIAGAHSAWELALHMTAWAEIVALRLDGEAREYPADEVDWPPVPEEGSAAAESAAAWRAARTRLQAAYDTLADRAAEVTEEQLGKKVPGQSYTTAIMLDGVIEHATYHGGQLVMLRRALAT
ncbi:MAG TPA: DinB family protein [Gemmatimonas sp.]|uniref:DinB family protein n=1 Tax=Gemmatimonas sp. TaxID=1962908 RepID=UPI002ED7A6D9